MFKLERKTPTGTEYIQINGIHVYIYDETKVIIVRFENRAVYDSLPEVLRALETKYRIRGNVIKVIGHLHFSSSKRQDDLRSAGYIHTHEEEWVKILA